MSIGWDNSSLDRISDNQFIQKYLLTLCPRKADEVYLQNFNTAYFDINPQTVTKPYPDTTLWREADEGGDPEASDELHNAPRETGRRHQGSG